jgi:hypothetical protein
MELSYTDALLQISCKKRASEIHFIITLSCLISSSLRVLTAASNTPDRERYVRPPDDRGVTVHAWIFHC